MNPARQTPPIRPSRRLDKAFAPVVAPLLNGRLRAAAFAMAGSLQVGFALAHLPGIPCPILHLFHVPCPGCGLSRASAATLRTDFGAAFRLHAFAPFFLLAIALFWIAALLPGKHRRLLVQLVDRIERRTALPTLLLIAVLFYWGLRFLYAPAQLSRLISG